MTSDPWDGYASSRRPFRLAFDEVMLGRGRRDGVIWHRAVDDEHTMVEVGAYFIGPYDSLLWVECLFWGSLEDEGVRVVPLSVKWGLQTGEALGFTRLVSDQGIAQLAAWHLLRKATSRGTPIEEVLEAESECSCDGGSCLTMF